MYCLPKMENGLTSFILDASNYYYVAVTGHRTLYHPEQLIKDKLKAFLLEIKQRETGKEIVLLTGMALGFDLIAAEVCLETETKYIACLPFASHLRGNEIFELLKQHAWKTIDVSQGQSYSKKLYLERDEYMVKNSKELYAYLIDKQNKHSGTFQTVAYGRKHETRISYFSEE